jgi:hypothetical protein
MRLTLELVKQNQRGEMMTYIHVRHSWPQDSITNVTVLCVCVCVCVCVFALYSVHHLKHNIKLIMYWATKIKLEADPSYNKLSAPREACPSQWLWRQQTSLKRQ